MHLVEQPVTSIRLQPVNPAAAHSPIIGLWPGSLSKSLPHTRTAWRLIDPEAVTSAPGLHRALVQRLTALTEDADHTAEWKQRQKAGVADSLFEHLADLARQVRELESEYRTNVTAAHRMEEPTASTTLIDMALAAQVKTEDRTPSSLMASASVRVREALVRLPIELSGITAETQAALHGSLLAPEKALEFEQMAEANGIAHKVIQRVIDEMVPYVSGSPTEQAATIGSGFRIGGVKGREVMP